MYHSSIFIRSIESELRDKGHDWNMRRLGRGMRGGLELRSQLGREMTLTLIFIGLFPACNTAYTVERKGI